MNPALINMILGFVWAFFTFAFGGWTQLLILLCIAMAIDYITGVAAAIRTGSRLNSKIGFWGLTRKGLMLLVILLAHQIDQLIGTDVIKGGAMYFYLANELISITENYNRIGLPLPAKLREIIELVKKQADDDEEEVLRRRAGDDEGTELRRAVENGSESNTIQSDTEDEELEAIKHSVDEDILSQFGPRKDRREKHDADSQGPE
ncbi:toxin secretion/phage lysis holin [Paenibacillus sp. 453mf]|nr:toxin secretion/phage lysis holin [Paenibacillus sp. 453mf]